MGGSGKKVLHLSHRMNKTYMLREVSNERRRLFPLEEDAEGGESVRDSQRDRPFIVKIFLARNAERNTS